MHYMLLIYGDEKAWEAQAETERQAMLAEYNAFAKAASAAGVMRGGDELLPTASATTVRVRDGKTLTTHGPFAETREQLGGFFVIECETVEQAVQWAGQIPGAREGSIEVRPVVQF